MGYKCIISTFSLLCLLSVTTNVFGFNNEAKAGQKSVHIPNDTLIVRDLVLKSSQFLESNNFDSTLYYGQKAVKLSNKIKYTWGLSNGYYRITWSFTHLGLNDSALKYNTLSQKYTRELNDSDMFAENILLLGHICISNCWYKSASKYYLEASKIFKRHDNLVGVNRCNVSIGNVYILLKEWKKCKYYFKSAVDFFNSSKVHYPFAWNQLALAYSGLGNPDSALICLKKAEEIVKKDTLCNCNFAYIYSSFGQLEIDLKNYQLAIQYLTKSNYYNNFSDLKQLGDNYIKLGKAYLKTGDNKKAINYFTKAIEFSKKANSKEGLATAYREIADYYEETGNSIKSLESYKKYVYFNDSLKLTAYNDDVAYWQNMYDLNEKENQLKSAHDDMLIKNITIRKNRIFQQFLIAIIGIIILISVLIYRNMRYKRILGNKQIELQQHQIHELENEKMLLATRSVLRGEENERKRIARDLHDGLGGLLTGTKSALNYMKGNVVLSSDTANDFDHALSLLESSITELRRVAHNMMPEALMKLGLKDTLSDFCIELNKVNVMDIRFQFYGEFSRVDSTLEINSFRIIQELVNNAIKYSQAKEVIVQMLQNPGRLCFIVIDDGIGFNVNDIDQTRGMGLASIKSRVAAFKGNFDIISAPDKGTEATVEFAV